MQRYFMNQSADENQCFFIENKEDYHHIVNVMRYKEGQNIIVTFSDENVFKCKIISINDQSIEIKLVEKQQINTELPQNITICSGLIKADKYEWMIQKATEMGANEFIIKFKSNLKEIYGMISQYDYVLIAYEEQAKHGELSQFKQTIKQFKTQDRVLIIFGPEGGLSDSEISLFGDVSTIVGLGPRILRAETAPLYALSAVSYEKELLG
ncbi:MAG: 16S rRNA (uracil(1498)-N(3))-methyltransferase [Staphylococcus epidermidis]|nr:16S rRNA (uracil(1498)-N(3))-methyltransferase [Staphylococcus epidermidis]